VIFASNRGGGGGCGGGGVGGGGGLGCLCCRGSLVVSCWFESGVVLGGGGVRPFGDPFCGGRLWFLGRGPLWVFKEFGCLFAGGCRGRAVMVRGVVSLLWVPPPHGAWAGFLLAGGGLVGWGGDVVGRGGVSPTHVCWGRVCVLGMCGVYLGGGVWGMGRGGLVVGVW